MAVPTNEVDVHGLAIRLSVLPYQILVTAAGSNGVLISPIAASMGHSGNTAGVCRELAEAAERNPPLATSLEILLSASLHAPPSSVLPIASASSTSLPSSLPSPLLGVHLDIVAALQAASLHELRCAAERSGLEVPPDEGTPDSIIRDCFLRFGQEAAPRLLNRVVRELRNPTLRDEPRR